MGTTAIFRLFGQNRPQYGDAHDRFEISLPFLPRVRDLSRGQNGLGVEVSRREPRRNFGGGTRATVITTAPSSFIPLEGDGRVG